MECASYVAHEGWSERRTSIRRDRSRFPGDQDDLRDNVFQCLPADTVFGGAQEGWEQRILA